MFRVQWDFHLLLDKKRWVNVTLWKEKPLGWAGKSSKWTLTPEGHGWEPWLPATSVNLGKMGGDRRTRKEVDDLHSLQQRNKSEERCLHKSHKSTDVVPPPSQSLEKAP